MGVDVHFVLWCVVVDGGADDCSVLGVVGAGADGC